MAKKTDLDDYRVPYFDGKKFKPFDLGSIDTAAKPFSLGTKDQDRVRLSELNAALDQLLAS